ncbi:MAG: MFS transporter [Candidatus Nanopelagicales bacterium]
MTAPGSDSAPRSGDGGAAGLARVGAAALPPATPPEGPDGHRWRADLSLLRDRDFALLFLARVVSVFGGALTPIALAFAVLDLPGGDASSLGLVLTAQAVPQIVFMLFGGVLADRFPRARVMMAAELLAGAVTLAAALLLLTGNATVSAIAALAALNGVAVAFLFPALTGIVPDIVEQGRLQAANALLRLATNVARILGTAAAGVLITTLGAGWAVLVDALTFFAAAVLLVGIRSRHASREGSWAPLRELRGGWREFSSRRWVVVVVVGFAFVNLGLAAGLGVLGPVQSNEVLGGAGPWAVLLTAEAVGTVLGVFVAMRLRPRRPMFVAVAAAPLVAVPFALLAIPAPLWLIAVTAFVAGVAIDVFSVLWDTALQQNVPEDSLSRVSAYDWLGSSLLQPVGLAIAGPVALALGTGSALWLCAAVIAVPLLLAMLDPQVRRLPAFHYTDAATPRAAST